MNPYIKEYVSIIESHGLELYGSEFRIHKEDSQLINTLLAYFTCDTALCHELNINLNKGLLIIGPVGVGKTSIMNLMSLHTALSQRFKTYNCRSLALQFSQEGPGILYKFCLPEYSSSPINNICFDELGAETNFKYFGSDCNIMSEILLSRYDHYINHNHITHIISNLNIEEIELRYGSRVRSRLRQMVNLISFDPGSPDKRR